MAAMGLFNKPLWLLQVIISSFTKRINSRWLKKLMMAIEIMTFSNRSLVFSDSSLSFNNSIYLVYAFKNSLYISFLNTSACIMLWWQQSILQTMLLEHFFFCPYCNAEISMLLDASVSSQEYIEDCEVCCNPIAVKFCLDHEVLTEFVAISIEQ